MDSDIAIKVDQVSKTYRVERVGKDHALEDAQWLILDGQRM